MGFGVGLGAGSGVSVLVTEAVVGVGGSGVGVISAHAERINRLRIKMAGVNFVGTESKHPILKFILLSKYPHTFCGTLDRLRSRSIPRPSLLFSSPLQHHINFEGLEEYRSGSKYRSFR